MFNFILIVWSIWKSRRKTQLCDHFVSKSPITWSPYILCFGVVLKRLQFVKYKWQQETPKRQKHLTLTSWNALHAAEIKQKDLSKKVVYKWVPFCRKNQPKINSITVQHKRWCHVTSKFENVSHIFQNQCQDWLKTSGTSKQKTTDKFLP